MVCRSALRKGLACKTKRYLVLTQLFLLGSVTKQI